MFWLQYFEEVGGLYVGDCFGWDVVLCLCVCGVVGQCWCQCFGLGDQCGG